MKHHLKVEIEDGEYPAACDGCDRLFEAGDIIVIGINSCCGGGCCRCLCAGCIAEAAKLVNRAMVSRDLVAPYGPRAP